MSREREMAVRDYSLHSLDYDAKRFSGKKNQYFQLIRNEALFKLIGSNKQRSILDVGCGTGRGVIALGERGYKDISGIDYTPEMIDLAKGKIDSLNLDNIHLYTGDANHLPFQDHTYDCVISLNFLHMFKLDSQKKMIQEMSRVLKPGGILVIEFDNYYRSIVMGGIEQRRKPRTNFNKPSDFNCLFSRSSDGLQIISKIGTIIPYFWRFMMHMPSPVSATIESVTKYYPMKYLSDRIFVKVVKAL